MNQEDQLINSLFKWKRQLAYTTMTTEERDSTVEAYQMTYRFLRRGKVEVPRDLTEFYELLK